MEPAIDLRRLWTVHQLVEQLVGGCALTAAVLAGQDTKARPEYADLPDNELASALRGVSAATTKAVDSPGALEQIVRVGFGPVPGAAAARLCLVEAMMGQIPAERSPFKPSTPVADDAPALDRPLALLGR